jgi:branched-chain amino acid transport system ATP-binding protein
VLAIDGLSVAYGGLRALREVSLEVREGEFVAIVGPNGAGKTTLFKTISGTVAAASGRIVYEGRDLLRIPAAERAQLGIAHVPEGRQVFRTMTVMENLEIGALSPTARAVARQPGRILQLSGARRAAARQLAGTLGRRADARHQARPRVMSLLLLDSRPPGLRWWTRLRPVNGSPPKAHHRSSGGGQRSNHATVVRAVFGRVVLEGRAALADSRVKQTYLGM